ncbi:hypothetical protein BJ322DRAFT_1018109 [Thelephora terrestris]|uniref:Uncharacterized protein n=1 Tax=Thelephora terrestris TaxID=56493 RepID=A0A9P6LAL1_9AGAM|nr:hypothetical protein BJ322DRAFT_1018109 [Thelephora terrestris]
MRERRTRRREERGRNEGIVGNYGTMKWRIKPRSQSGIGVKQAGGGERGETVETAITCNKRAGGHVFQSQDDGPMRGDPNNDEQGDEASQVRWENGSDRVARGIGEVGLGAWT